MRILRNAGWLMTSLLTIVLTAGAQSQQPAPKPEEKPKPAKKAKKVWTEEDLQAIRKPSDDYLDQKQAQEASVNEAVRTGGEQKPSEQTDQEQPRIDPVSGKPIYDPDSPEGLAEQIENWEKSIVRTAEALSEARTRMSEVTDPVRAESAKQEVEIHEQNLVDMRQRLEQLKARLADAKSAKQGKGKDATPPPPQAPSQSPPPQR